MKLKFTSMSKTLTNLLAVQMITLCITTSLLASNIELRKRVNTLEKRTTTNVDFRDITLLTSNTLSLPQTASVEPVTEVEDAVISEEIAVVEQEGIEPVEVSIDESIVEESVVEYSQLYSEDEIYTMAKVCMAEAENQSEYGKRLVISTILNRLDSGIYGSTIYDVVYAPYQFEVTMNGRLERVEPDDYMIELVRQEISNRSNYDVFYFRTNYYSEYGTPMFIDGDHYFSSR